MIIVTGGAGFIGSVLVAELNKRGRSDVLVVDAVQHDEQEHNVAPLHYEQLVSGEEFRQQLAEGFYDDKEVEAIFHLGANSATVGVRSEYEDVNVVFSQEVIRWCVDRDVRCVYASSGATYGMGEKGYSDDHELFDQLQPLNEYGKSKLVVDIWARDGGYLDQVVGLRYFNVFGPNEWHKGGQRSVVAKKYEQMRDEGFVELFESNNEKYGDGEQMRDFIYVFDAVRATLFFLENREVSGVFNIGTGKARTWNDLAEAMFRAVGKEPNIRYVPIPGELAEQYQDFTQADITKLRKAGFKEAFTSLEEAVQEYIVNYLEPHTHIEA